VIKGTFSFLFAFAILSSCSVDNDNHGPLNLSSPSDLDELQSFLDSENTNFKDLNDSLSGGAESPVVDVEVATESVLWADPPIKNASLKAKLKAPNQYPVPSEQLSRFKAKTQKVDTTTLQSSDHPQVFTKEETSDLLSEISILRNNLSEKVSLISALKQENRLLEQRLLNLSPPVATVSSQVVESRMSESFDSNTQLKVAVDPLNYLNNSDNLRRCELSFDAGISLQNGKYEEAFYTEFFLLPNSLEIILKRNGFSVDEISNIGSVAELWAKSNKHPYQFPGVLKSIRNALLEEVAKGDGFRIRTDLNGNGVLNNIPVGVYFLVGNASLGITGVTWNLPLNLKEGQNRIALTSQNASWFH